MNAMGDALVELRGEQRPHRLADL